MAYISSSCVSNRSIAESVKQLIGYGFRQIELSGGTRYYDNFESDLISIKKNEQVSFLLHNYFPPPKEAFILNLAAVNEEQREKSMDHCKRAIELSSELGGDKYGVHAGYFIDIPMDQLGKSIGKSNVTDEEKGMDLFCKSFEALKEFCGGQVRLYIENNVLSETNFKNFDQLNPFMLTDSNSYQKLRDRIDFNLLLDVAHLKVSATTLGLDLKKEFEILYSQSDYIHISDNDGRHDQNLGMNSDSDLLPLLKGKMLQHKTITLEVYQSEEIIKETLNILDRA